MTGVNVAKAYADYIVSEMYPDKSELLDNCNHIGITLLAIERCNHKLRTAYNMDELLLMCRSIILGTASNIVRHGKNWYVDNGSVRFTINSTTFMIVTADRLSNID